MGLYIDNLRFLPDLNGGGTGLVTGFPGTMLSPFFEELNADDIFEDLNKIDCDWVQNDLYIFRKGIGCEKSVYLQDDGRINWGVVEQLYRKESATVYLRAYQRYSAAIKTLSKKIEDALPSTRVFVNLFATPPNSVGLLPHLDPTEFFVLQISGLKIWKFWRQSTLEEISNMDLEARTAFAKSIAEKGEPSSVIYLRKGQVMYVPRFKIHSPFCESHNSIHLTIGIATPEMKKYYD